MWNQYVFQTILLLWTNSSRIMRLQESHQRMFNTGLKHYDTGNQAVFRTRRFECGNCNVKIWHCHKQFSSLFTALRSSRKSLCLYVYNALMLTWCLHNWIFCKGSDSEMPILLHAANQLTSQLVTCPYFVSCVLSTSDQHCQWMTNWYIEWLKLLYTLPCDQLVQNCCRQLYILCGLNSTLVCLPVTKGLMRHCVTKFR